MLFKNQDDTRRLCCTKLDSAVWVRTAMYHNTITDSQLSCNYNNGHQLTNWRPLSKLVDLQKKKEILGQPFNMLIKLIRFCRLFSMNDYVDLILKKKQKLL